jgi:hypothetical protein
LRHRNQRSFERDDVLITAERLGLQIVHPQYADATVLRMPAAFEAARPRAGGGPAL